MITTNEQITKLVGNLQKFLNNSHETLNNVLQGMCLSKSLVSDNETNNISRIIDKISNVDEMMSSFKIGIRKISEPEYVWVCWTKTGNNNKQFNYEKDLTEKMFNFILMSFEREISQRLSIIEEANNGYIYFCSCIKNSLHNIITEYMTA